MNLTNANTEPYYQFHRRCEEFDRTMRITVAALAIVRQQQRTARGPVTLPTDGEPFGDNLWNQSGQKVLPAKRLLAHMGSANIITLLEDFCVGLKGEHDRFTAGSGQRAERHDAGYAEANGLSPKPLYARLRFRKDTRDRVEPIYEYFVKVRNCVIHRSGRATSELHRYAGQPKLRACVEDWEGPRAVEGFPRFHRSNWERRSRFSPVMRSWRARFAAPSLAMPRPNSSTFSARAEWSRLLPARGEPDSHRRSE
jgi:hypothetical protein